MSRRFLVITVTELTAGPLASSKHSTRAKPQEHVTLRCNIAPPDFSRVI